MNGLSNLLFNNHQVVSRKLICLTTEYRNLLAHRVLLLLYNRLVLNTNLSLCEIKSCYLMNANNDLVKSKHFRFNKCINY